MLVENSIVVANFIRGLFVPLGALTVAAIIAAITVLILGIDYDGNKKILWWELPIAAFLMFSLWFFSTFTLR